MDINESSQFFKEKMAQIKTFVESEAIRDIMGVEAVNHFQGSFDNEGFTDKSLKPWKDVARRDPNSPWYGHEGFTAKGETTSKSQQRLNKKNSDTIGNFSQERASAKVLKGKTGELRNALYYTPTDTGVRITSPTAYGRVHQFGLLAKIYGKGSFQMPARPFIGKSVLLKNNIEDKIKREFIKILKK